jgi:sterol desaturase/sphingolipid hydroxylase (fatty acid hydroxylase superfamily)
VLFRSLYFAPTWKKGLAALVLVPVIGALAALVVGVEAGLSFGLGYALTYVGYEVLHRRIHTHAPINAYFAWMRRHHLHHHVSPKVNHGVTTPLWDLALATREVAEPVSLHRKLAPKWLVNEQGEVRAEFATEYRLVGRA